MIKAVLIDIDDTLLDFDLCADWAIHKSAQKLQLNLPENTFEVFWKYNDALWKELERGIITTEELFVLRWERTFAHLGVLFDAFTFDECFRTYLTKSGMHVQGAEALLSYLSEKYDVYTASNGPVSQQPARMETSGLAKYIKKNFISEEIGYAKPTKGFFDYCLKHMNGEKKHEIIMVGDSLTADMKGAHDYGLKCIWYNRTHASYDEVDADYVVEHLTEIKTIL